MRRTFSVALVVLGLAATTSVGLGQNLVASAVPGDWVRAHIVAIGVALAMVTALAVLVDTWVRRRNPHPTAEAILPDQVLASLARNVRDELRRVDAVQGVGLRLSLPVSWVNADEDLHSPWPEVHGAVGQTDPVRLDGRFEDIKATFRHVPSERLVILGRAGSGKSVLATRLALALLEDRDGPAPVPLLLAAHAWPQGSDLDEWLIREVLRRLPDVDPRHVTDLVRDRRVWPIIDGLDEVPHNHRAAMIRALDEAGPMVVTSREQEFRDTCRTAGAVTASAAIIVRDLEPAESVAYLTARRSQRTPQARWSPLLAGHPALRTPLLVVLAAEVYEAVDREPAELLDAERFPTVEAVEEHLFEVYLDRVYPRPADRLTWRRRKPPSVWTADEARHWHGRLALLLSEQWRADISPWNLSDSLGHLSRGLLPSLTTTILFAVLAAFSGIGSPVLLAALPITALFYGLANASYDRYADVSWRRLLRPAAPQERQQRFLHAMLRGCALGVGAVGLGEIAWQLLRSPRDEALSTAIPSAAVILCVLLIGAGRFRSRLTLDAGAAATLWDSWTRMRRVAMVEVLTFAALVAAPMSGVLLIALRPTGRSGTIAVVGVVLGSCAVVWWLTAWGQWGSARMWLTVRGDLPLCVVAFWREAERLGVLRNDGDVYAFRHLLLRDFLVRSAIGEISDRRVRTSRLRESVYHTAIQRRPAWALQGLESVLAERRAAGVGWSPEIVQANLELAIARFSADPSEQEADQIRQIVRDTTSRRETWPRASVTHLYGQLGLASKTVGDVTAAADCYYQAAQSLRRATWPHALSVFVFHDEINFFLNLAQATLNQQPVPQTKRSPSALPD